MDVITAVITAQGEDMTSTSITEEPATKAAATGEDAKPPKKPRAGARRAHVATKKAKSGKKATPAKKAPKGEKKGSVRDGSKAAKIVELLKRPGGATSKELEKATGWQPHSVRGFLSGTIRKRKGLAVTSTKGEDGERSYSIKS